jgi:hypothetical protein
MTAPPLELRTWVGLRHWHLICPKSSACPAPPRGAQPSPNCVWPIACFSPYTCARSLIHGIARGLQFCLRVKGHDLAQAGITFVAGSAASSVEIAEVGTLYAIVFACCAMLGQSVVCPCTPRARRLRILSQVHCEHSNVPRFAQNDCQCLVPGPPASSLTAYGHAAAVMHCGTWVCKHLT